MNYTGNINVKATPAWKIQHGFMPAVVVEKGDRIPSILEGAPKQDGYAFSPNSAYRTVSHNAKPDVGGSPRSYHIYGMAVDIPAKGNTTPQMLYDFFDELLGNSGELGIYSWGVHVAVCENKKRFKA